MRQIGVTGTDGKTSTVHMLGAIGRAANMRVLVSSSLGVWCGGAAWVDAPQELGDMLDAAARRGVEWAAIELTSRTLGEGIADAIDFDAAVLTNVTEDHLDIHGSIDAYVAAKTRLFSRVRIGGVAVLPSADAHASAFASVVPEHATILRYDDPRDVELDLAGTRMTLDDRTFTIPPIGRGFAHDALAAARAARALDISMPAVITGLGAAPRLPARFEVIAEQPTVVIDFAHTAAALRSTLETARALTHGRVLLVFGAGGDRMTAKRAPMGRAAAQLADLVWITADNSRSEDPAAIADAIASGWSGVDVEPPWIELHRPSAIAAAMDAAAPDDLVLVAGMGADAYVPAPGEPPTTDAAVVHAHSMHDG